MKNIYLLISIFLIGGEIALSEGSKEKKNFLFKGLEKVFNFEQPKFTLFNRKELKENDEDKFNQILVDFSNDMSFENKLKVFSILKGDENISEEEAMSRIREKIRSGEISQEEKKNIINELKEGSQETTEDEDVKIKLEENNFVVAIDENEQKPRLPIASMAKNIFDGVRSYIGNILNIRVVMKSDVEQGEKNEEEMRLRQYTTGVDELFNEYYEKFTQEAYLIQGVLRRHLLESLEGKGEEIGEDNFKEEIFSDALPKYREERKAKVDMDLVAFLGYRELLRSGEIKMEKQKSLTGLEIPFTIGPIEVVPKTNLEQKAKMSFSQEGVVNMVIEKKSPGKVSLNIVDVDFNAIGDEDFVFDSSIKEYSKEFLAMNVRRQISSLQINEFMAGILQELVTSPEIKKYFLI